MTNQLSSILSRPLRIGSRWTSGRLVLAPMTQLGHVAYRQLLAEYGGAGLMFSEMCSAKAIPTENRRVSRYFRWRNAERSHLVWQIFGSEPEAMATAAQRIEAEGFFGVDINFGCCAAPVCRRNGGAALLKNPRAAVAIVAAVRRAVRLPLFVKYRTGWKDDPALAVDLARRFESTGADALTFHPRVAPDRRARPARWPYIGLIKQAVAIPVFGNGDVFDARDCAAMLAQTGCDGVALGRLAIAQPWVFAAWTGGRQPAPSIYLHTARRMVELLWQHFDPPSALRRYRKFAHYFAANFRFGHAFYRRILAATDRVAIEAALKHFFARVPDLTSRPNMNFLP